MEDAGNKIFKKNLDCLKNIDPKSAEKVLLLKKEALPERLNSKSGATTLKINGVFLHSAYDPEKEGEVFASRALKEIKASGIRAVCVFGLGLGYHLKNLIGKKLKIFVVEPDLKILKSAMESIDLTTIFNGTLPVFGNRGNFFTPVRAVYNGKTAVLIHRPSAVINRHFYHRFLCQHKMETAFKNRKKFFFIFPVAGGTLPIARYCAGALKALYQDMYIFDSSVFYKQIKYIIQLFDNKKEINDRLESYMTVISDEIYRHIMQVQPDYVIAVSQSPVNCQTLNRLKKDGIKTICWFLEDYRNHDYAYWQGLAPLYDYFFTIQDESSGIFKRLEYIGTKHYYHLPGAASEKVHRPMDLGFNEKKKLGADIALLGVGYPNRQRLLARFTDKKLKIWGTGWNLKSPLGAFVQKNGRWILEDEAARIYNATGINLNTHYSSNGTMFDSNGGYINPRTYEIAACRSFQLIDNRYNLDSYFERDKEIIVYDDIDSLQSLVEYYLSYPEKRRKIAKKSYARVLAEHTYGHRMKEMLAFIDM